MVDDKHIPVAHMEIKDFQNSAPISIVDAIGTLHWGRMCSIGEKNVIILKVSSLKASVHTCAGRQESNEWVTDGEAWLSSWLQSANASGTSGLCLT